MKTYEKHLVREAFNSWELKEFLKRANNKRAWERRDDSIGLRIRYDSGGRFGMKDGHLVVQLMTPDNLKGKGTEKRHGKYKATVEVIGSRKHLGDFDTEDKAKKALIDFMTKHIKDNPSTRENR